MPRDPPVTAATPSFDVAVTHTDQASVIGMPQPASVMVPVSGSGPPRFPVSRAASCSEVSSKSTSKFSAIRAGLVALGIAERPALVPEMDALAGDAELAGHLGLTDAGGEQLGGAEPTGLEPFAFSLCRRTASNGWPCLILTGGTRPHQLSRQTNTQNPLVTRRPEAEDAHGLLTGLADTTRNRAGRLPVGKQPRPG
jgi:hypothetical protein